MAKRPRKRERLENAGLIKPSDRSPETKKILKKITHRDIDKLINLKNRKLLHPSGIVVKKPTTSEGGIKMLFGIITKRGFVI